MKTKFLSIIICLVSLFAVFAGCAGRADIRDDFEQEIDAEKLQLNVKYYNGGFGRDWLDVLIDEFEQAYAGVEFSGGKTGVQVIKEFDKRNVSADEMRGNSNHVFLMEESDYYTFVANRLVMDITDVVTDYATLTPDAKETERTIEQKMTSVYRSFFNIGTEQQPQYYGLPLFETSINLNYNLDTFENKLMYFAEGKTAENYTEADFENEDKIYDLFITDKNAARAYGPDGKTGGEYSLDDGLPATYKDFRALLEYMDLVGVTPFIWNGYETGYLTGLINDVWANNEGADQMMLNFTFGEDGTENKFATNLVGVDDAGNILYESDGSVKIQDPVEINASNAYMLQLQKGKLDALVFAEMMVEQGNYYKDSFESGFSNTAAQDCFVKPDSYLSQPIGFLVDGGWWFKEMDQRGVFATEEERQSYRFAVLPLPKADATQIGKPNTKVSDRRSWIFINSTCTGEVAEVAKAFVSFLQSDHALETYTRYTDTMRAMDYTVSEETLSSMSYYGRSVYNTAKSNGTTVLPWLPLSDTTQQQSSALSYRNYGFSVDSFEGNPLIYLHDHPGVTIEEYFTRIYNYRKG